MPLPAPPAGKYVVNAADAIPSSLVFGDATVETARSAKSVNAPKANYLATAVQAAGKINVGVPDGALAKLGAPVSRSRVMDCFDW